MQPECDLSSPGFLANPYRVLSELQAHSPIHYRRQHGDWLILRHGDVYRLYQDYRRLRSTRPNRPNTPLASEPSDKNVAEWLDSVSGVEALWLPQRDPPEHTRIRRVIQPLYAPALVQQMVAATAAAADELLARMAQEARGQVDLMAAFVAPLMQRSIGALFAIPAAHIPRLGVWSQDILRALELDESREIYLRGQQAFARFSLYMRSRLRAERQVATILDSLGEAAQPGQLSEAESVAQAVLLYISGHATTQDLIGNALFHLLREPGLRAHLVDHPARIPDLLRETLRYEPPTFYSVRWSHEGMDLLGEKIAPGQRILLMIAAANRDPRHFAEPHRFNIDRPPGPSLAFGHGIHRCVGAHLAPLVAQVALERLLHWFPSLCLDDAYSPRWRATFMFRGLDCLPVCYT